MTVREMLVETRTNYATQLLELSNPLKRKPNYTIGNRSVQWQAYQEFLEKRIESLNALIAMEDDGDTGGFTVTAIE